jgi:hypothetical protein
MDVWSDHTIDRSYQSCRSYEPTWNRPQRASPDPELHPHHPRPPPRSPPLDFVAGPRYQIERTPSAGHIRRWEFLLRISPREFRFDEA